MNRSKTKMSALAIFFAGSMTLAAVQFSGAGGCGGGAGGGGGGGGTTRNLTGTVAASSLSGLRINGKTQALACTDLQVCCAAYDGGTVVADVAADCTFTLALPLENFCYCALFTGEDGDANGCGDEYVASLGCSENGYSGAIPIFPDDDDSTDDIDVGTGTIEGSKVVATGNPCAQVDQDNDGADDAEDTDDDGDSTEDGDDEFNSFGCENADEFDSDDNGVPDIFESEWASDFAALKLQTDGTDALSDFFADSDGDDVPDGCDVDFGCEADAFDADGDCIPDEFDFCSDDADGDGLGICFDCDDSNADIATSTACYDDFCATDSDGDGFGLCDDCDDEDPEEQYECFGDDYCAFDEDADGFGLCTDCDDTDGAITTECYADCLEDNDFDGFSLCSDCDDFDETITSECYTGTDVCTTIDNDADGVFICDDCDDGDSTNTTTFSDPSGCPNLIPSTSCTSDAQCQTAVSTAGGDAGAVSGTTCDTASGECQVNCNLSSDPFTCTSIATTNGAFCGADQVCFFFP